MTRRAFLRVALAVASAPVLGTFAVRKGYPASVGTGTVAQWRWVALPDSGGLQVFVTAQASGGRPVSWTADGVVTCGTLSVTAPPVGSDPNTQHVSSGAGFGLAVRRATT